MLPASSQLRGPTHGHAAPADPSRDVLARIAGSVARLGRTPQDLFHQLDADRDGRLTRGELEPTLRSLQPDLSPPQLSDLFRRFDRDGNGQVELYEFCSALAASSGASTAAPAAAPAAPRAAMAQDVLARIASSVARLGRTPQDLFHQLDADRDGRLTRAELEPTLRSLQPDLTPPQLSTLFQRLDRDGSGQVELHEFCSALAASSSAPAAAPAAAPHAAAVQDVLSRIASSVARLGRRPEDLFHQLDADRDGKLSRRELEPTLCSLQPDLSRQQLDALFGRFDRDGNGQVELREFCGALQLPAHPPPQHLAQPAPTTLGHAAAGEHDDILSRIAGSVARLGRRPEELFHRLDANGDGRLTRAELEPTLRSLQPDLLPQQLDGIFRRFDRDGSGEVELHEFCSALNAPQQRHQQQLQHPAAQTLPQGQDQEMLARIASSIARLGRRPDELFFQLDANRDGRLTRAELEPTLRSLQPDLLPQQLDAIFRRFDRDGNGEVELHEFSRALLGAAAAQQTPAPPPPPSQGQGGEGDILARIAASVARLGRRPDELFFTLDANKDGRLTRPELEPTLRQLQPDVSPGQLEAIFRRFDRDGNGEVELQEFCNALRDAAAGHRPQSDFVRSLLARIASSLDRLGSNARELFAQLDTSRDGRLSRAELEPTLQRLQPDVTPQQLDAVFRQFDRDGSQQVELEEFVAALQQARVAQIPTVAVPPPPPPGASPMEAAELAEAAARYAARRQAKGGGPLALVVEQEDLLGGGPAAIGARLPEGMPRNRGSHRGEVYVQNARDATRFKSVSGHRVRRMYDSGASGGGGSAGSSTSRVAKKADSAAASEAASRVAAVRRAAALMDPDAVRLRPLDSPEDAEVLELLRRSGESEALADLIFFISQCLVAGLGLTAGVLAQGSGQGGWLMAAMVALSPGFNGLAMVLAQVALLGSLYQASRDVKALRELEDSSGPAQGDSETRGERQAWRRVVLSSLRTMVNFALFTCSLLGSRADAYLHVANAAAAAGLSVNKYLGVRGEPLAVDTYLCGDSATADAGITVDSAAWLVAAPEAWEAEGMRNLLAARCWLSLTALALSFLSAPMARAAERAAAPAASEGW